MRRGAPIRPITRESLAPMVERHGERWNIRPSAQGWYALATLRRDLSWVRPQGRHPVGFRGSYVRTFLTDTPEELAEAIEQEEAAITGLLADGTLMADEGGANGRRRTEDRCRGGGGPLMLLPTRLDRWFAEAVTRVYAPWLTSDCLGIGDRQRREVAELIERARRVACLPPLEPAPAPSRRTAPLSVRSRAPVRASTGRWVRAVA